MTSAVIPPTITDYFIGEDVIARTCEVLTERGEEGVEAVVLWLGAVLAETRARVLSAYVPEQVAYRTASGLCVEITRRGLSRLMAELPKGVFVLVRVHSHSHDAFHSDVDDANMVISHQGAISIVVPDFCRHGLDLARCSVNELRRGEGWRELASEEVSRRFHTLPTTRV